MDDEQRKPAIQSSKEIQISPEIPKLDVSIATEKSGRSDHPTNEDYADARHNYFVVADGIGQHEDGNLASQAAVRNLIDRGLPSTIKYLLTKDSLLDKRLADSLIKSSFKYANFAVLEENEKKRYPEDEQPGTTASFGMVFEDENKDKWLLAGNVGDTTIAVFRSETKRLNHITLKHIDSLEETYPDPKKRMAAQMRIDRAKNPKEDLNPKDYAAYEQDNFISSSLGSKDPEDRKSDSHAVRLYPGDRIIAYTDGIETLTIGEIEKLLSKHKNNKRAAKKILDAAGVAAYNPSNPRKNDDDRTIVVIGVI